jgi:ribosomal protein S18 acetylase RimI-like enzyme
MIKVKRYFLEIILKNYKIASPFYLDNISLSLDTKKDFNLNKFFYKQIGIDHFWRDRLIWSDGEWKKYVSNKNFQTWVLKKNNELIGYYEAEFHVNKNEFELINMGVLKNFRKKKYGSLLLLHSIKKAIELKSSRIWVHTCSLDHKYALPNYKSKGFKVFKEENIDFLN